MVKTSIPASKKEKFYRESEGSAKNIFFYIFKLDLFVCIFRERETHHPTSHSHTPCKKKHDSRK